MIQKDYSSRPVKVVALTPSCKATLISYLDIIAYIDKINLTNPENFGMFFARFSG